MNVRFGMIAAWVSATIFLGIVGCTKSDSQESLLGAEYAISVDPENPSILEEFSVTVLGPPTRALSLEISGPEAAGVVSCQDSAQSSTESNAGSHSYKCLFQISGLYHFKAMIEGFSGGMKEFSSDIQVGNTQRFALTASQGALQLGFRSSSASVQGSGSLLTDSLINFHFDEGGESARVVFVDGPTYSGPDFSHTFSIGGPQSFRVEMRDQAGKVKMSRDYNLVVHCNGTSAAPAVVDHVEVALQADGSYQYTPVYGSGQAVAFRMDANGDGTMDTQTWIKTSSRKEYSMLVSAADLNSGKRTTSVLSINRCGDVTSYSGDVVITPDIPGSGRSYIAGIVRGAEGNAEFSANTDFIAMAAQGALGERRYSFSWDRLPSSNGGVSVRVDAEQNAYIANTDDDKHGLHVKFPLPSDLIPSGAGSNTATVLVPRGQMQYQTAKEGDAVVGRIYSNADPVSLRLAVEKTKVEGGECSPSGHAQNRYELKIHFIWDEIQLQESISVGSPMKINIAGFGDLYEGMNQGDPCTPAPTCIFQSEGTLVGGSVYDGFYYVGKEAGIRLNVNGAATSITLNGSSASGGRQLFTPSSAGTMHFSATVSNAGGTQSCASDIQVHEMPGTGCTVSLSPNRVVAGPSAFTTAYLSVRHLPLYGGSLSTATINGQNISGNSLQIPVTSVGGFTVNAAFTTSSGDSGSCSGGGTGEAAPGAGCYVSGSSSTYQGLATSYQIVVSNASYHGNTWTGSLGGNAVSSSNPSQQMTFQTTGQFSVPGSITMADGSTAVCSAQPVTVVAIPAPQCSITFSGSLIQGQPKTIYLNTLYEGLNGGVTSAMIDGVSVSANAMYRQETFASQGQVTLNGQFTSGNGITVTCSAQATVQAPPPPPGLSCTASVSPNQVHKNQATTVYLSVGGLSYHGNSLISVAIDGQAQSNPNAYSWPKTWSTEGNKTAHVVITSQDGSTASCDGAAAVIPDDPPPPTATCTVSVRHVNGSAITGPILLGESVLVSLSAQNATSSQLTTPSGTGAYTSTVTYTPNSPGMINFSGAVNGPGGNGTCVATIDVRDAS